MTQLKINGRSMATIMYIESKGNQRIMQGKTGYEKRVLLCSCKYHLVAGVNRIDKNRLPFCKTLLISIVNINRKILYVNSIKTTIWCEFTVIASSSFQWRFFLFPLLLISVQQALHFRPNLTPERFRLQDQGFGPPAHESELDLFHAGQSAIWFFSQINQ